MGGWHLGDFVGGLAASTSPEWHHPSVGRMICGRAPLAAAIYVAAQVAVFLSARTGFGARADGGLEALSAIFLPVRWRGFLAIVREEGVLVGIVLRLAPVVPSAAACLIAAGLGIKFGVFMLGTVAAAWVRPLFFCQHRRGIELPARYHSIAGNALDVEPGPARACLSRRSRVAGGAPLVVDETKRNRPARGEGDRDRAIRACYPRLSARPGVSLHKIGHDAHEASRQ